MRKKTLGPFELRILQFIRHHNLLQLRQPVLCAVSGGLDSMVMLALLHSLGFGVEVLHVNFGLRGNDSEEDQKLVEHFCRQLSIPFHLKKIEPDEWKRAEWKGQSIQMIARTLRYNWFRQMAARRGVDRIAVAHHADDQAETILLQVLRGGGLSALAGMSPQTGLMIRPLLETNRAELEAFAHEKNIAWRQDQSNLESKYDRNRIRNEVFPLLESAFPGFQKVLNRNASRWQAYAEGIEFVRNLVAHEVLISQTDSHLILDFERLRHHPAGKLWLLECATPEGFRLAQVEEMWAHQASGESKTWYNQAGTKQIEIRGNRFTISAG